MPETFDLYDAAGNPLGRVKPRDAVHRDGDWHRSAHVWIYTSDGRLLFQRRRANKDTWPRRLDASVGGHYRAGEGVEAVPREAREELGLVIAPVDLVPLGTRRVESIEPGVRDRELQDVYLLRRDLPLTAYCPDPAEIDALTLLDAHDAARLHAGALERLEAAILAVGATNPEMHMLTSDDLIPGRGPYLAALDQAVAGLLVGQTPTRQSIP